MQETPFYKDHWVSIDRDRLAQYRDGFAWSPEAAPLYEPACIEAGQTVADFGCGPGHTAVEMARWVGPSGHVHAFDINEDFLTMVGEHGEAAGVADRMTTHKTDGRSLSLADGSLDRISARNAIMYVDDPLETLMEFRRVLRPNSLMHAIEGDWRMMVAEPVDPPLWSAFVEAAGHACKTVDMGRKLYDLAGRAGFADRSIRIVARPDTSGTLLPMVRNMGKYAKVSGRMAVAEVERVVATMETALADSRYLVVSPQFVVTGRK